jgi:hypothetical protein
MQTCKHGRYDRRKKQVLLVSQIRGGKKMQVKNDSVELFFLFHFWVFEVRRFRNPTNKISVALDGKKSVIKERLIYYSLD